MRKHLGAIDKRTEYKKNLTKVETWFSKLFEYLEKNNIVDWDSVGVLKKKSGENYVSLIKRLWL